MCHVVGCLSLSFNRPSFVCSQRICCITVWTKTPRSWSATLDCQKLKVWAVSCPQPVVRLDTWVRHLFFWSDWTGFPHLPFLFHVSSELAVSADISSLLTALWEVLSSTTDSIASVSEVLSTCLTWPDRSHGITERSRSLEFTLCLVYFHLVNVCCVCVSQLLRCSLRSHTAKQWIAGL